MGYRSPKSLYFQISDHIPRTWWSLAITKSMPYYPSDARLPSSPHPALHTAQTGILGRPAAHGVVRGLQFRVNGLICDALELLHQPQHLLSQGSKVPSTLGEEGGCLSYNSQLVITLSQLGLVRRGRPPSQEDLLPVLDPALRGSLAEVNLLGLVASGKGVEENSVSDNPMSANLLFPTTFHHRLGTS